MSEIEARLCPFCRDCVNLQVDLLSDGDFFVCPHCRGVGRVSKSVYVFLVSGEDYNSRHSGAKVGSQGQTFEAVRHKMTFKDRLGQIVRIQTPLPLLVVVFLWLGAVMALIAFDYNRSHPMSRNYLLKRQALNSFPSRKLKNDLDNLRAQIGKGQQILYSLDRQIFGLQIEITTGAGGRQLSAFEQNDQEGLFVP